MPLINARLFANFTKYPDRRGCGEVFLKLKVSKWLRYVDSNRDLAHLYQVKPIALRHYVRRNPKRFPADFLFELDEEEVQALLSENVIFPRRSLGGSRPLAFTGQGISMLSSVDRAIEVKSRFCTLFPAILLTGCNTSLIRLINPEIHLLFN